jgi:hypothetical protein
MYKKLLVQGYSPLAICAICPATVSEAVLGGTRRLILVAWNAHTVGELPIPRL